MSRQAIAAVLARTDLASGERLVALSLASFAGRENRAWPGAPAASARAGLSRSRYQQAREKFVTRGLLGVEERTTGRGRASTVTLLFADTGPWWDGDINVELFEAVLGCSRVRGPERFLLATMAAVADEDGAVRDLSTDQLCSGGRYRGQDIPARAHCAAGVRLDRAGQRRRRPREHERVDGAKSARARRRCPQPRPTARCAAGRRTSTHRVGRLARRCGSGSATGDRGRRKGRPGSDTYRWKQSDPDRGFRDERAVTIGQFGTRSVQS